MRVTMRTIHENILNNLNRTTTDMNRLNAQISSGKQMSKPSDDPVNLVTALGLRTGLADINQYKRNIIHGENVIAASESSLTQIKELISRAKVLAVQQVNASVNQEQRVSAASEVHNLWEQAIILSNTQVNNKYIFGGYRTEGYTAAEPAPFVADAVDGYLINGSQPARMDSALTGTVTNTTITAGDLAINGTATAADILTGAVTNGLNMEKAFNAKTVIEATDPNVSVNLTTLHAGAAATADTADATDTLITFELNGEPVSVLIPDGSNAATVATLTVAAINAKSTVTGVDAVVGDGATNGGAVDAVVFRNVLAGDDSAITVANFTTVSGDADPNFSGTGNFSQAADSTHNTGQISLSSASSFILTSPNHGDDTILTDLGLAGGNLGFADEANDGELIYGARLDAGDLKINGQEVTTTADSVSDIYQDISAAARADAINTNSGQLGVRAEVTPAHLLASGAVEAGAEDAKLTGTVTNNAILAGDLAINGIATFADIAAGAVVNGLNMGKAANAKAVFNAMSSSTDVTASLTTLSAGVAADSTAGTPTISFSLNGITVDVNANGKTPVEVSLQVRDAINAVSDQTGVTAVRGDGNNGGAINSVVLYNTLDGDETPITISGLSAAETLRSGLSDISQSADAAHNTGTINLSSDNPFSLSSPNNLADDFILDELGLGGGEGDTAIPGDVADDGTLDYGSTPVYLTSGDLRINGVDIFLPATAIKLHDTNNNLINSINAKTDQTGVVAGRDSAGRIFLKALDGRNLHIETSARGEKVTHLNGGTAQPHDKVYFGSVRLLSDREFTLESNITPVDTVETGFAAMGLTGGSAATGQTGDVADDGSILVNTIYRENGQVRYAGDRNNDIAIKVGQLSTITISKNGKDAIFETGVFSVLKNFEDYLRGQNYKSVTGSYQSADTSVTLDSGETGLTLEELLTQGSFTITVTSHDTSPPQDLTPVEIAVNPSEDTLEDVAQRINAVPGLTAAWDDGGYLRIETTDPARYTFSMGADTSNFLKVAGISTEDFQIHSLSDSLSELDQLMEDLTAQISDFGARSNRITVQTQIFDNLELATAENLTEQEDTDMVKALMELKNKEVAFQAALSAAAKTMQLSLVNFLN